MNRRLFLSVTVLALLLTYVVIVLGAWVRLTDAGLGCPDWPGCYGRLLTPPAEQAEAINSAYPDRPYNRGKAWREMLHRYAAGTLGILVLVLAVVAWVRYRQHRGLCSLLLGLVLFQALLGMWTVTLLLKPVVVSAHLLGGMAVLSLLFLLLLRQTGFAGPVTGHVQRLYPLAWLLLILLTVQIFLGGWTSSNYAALVCPEFPACRDGVWLPPADFTAGFTLWRGLGVDYEGGVLDAAGRTAIHLSHRAGALVVLLTGVVLVFRLLRSGDGTAVKLAVTMLMLLLLQAGLGVSNIIMVLPLPVAVAHNGVAALLLLSVIATVSLTRGSLAGKNE